MVQAMIDLKGHAALVTGSSKGVGKAIYDQFIPSNVEAGFHTLLAGIRLPNDACVRLHERFGFRHVGTLPEVGYKFDEWHDVGYWALTPDL